MSRRDIYYWKCDRPAAFHGTGPRPRGDEVPEEMIRGALVDHFRSERIALNSAAGQGNHLTWNAEIDGAPAFLRIENGPEGDDQLAMESAVLGEVAKTGVPVPRVLGCDASRTRVPFAWQALERIPHPDLNQWWKAGSLDEAKVAYEIGRNVARWQSTEPRGFGPFDLGAWRAENGLVGFHADYPAYYRLRLDEHLRFLEARSFLSAARAGEIRCLIGDHADPLQLKQGVLVHKDLALWNVLGPPDAVAAVIDFDDAIGGDPLDDLSLLACFHDRAFLEQAFAGYASKRPLPGDWRPRFWLHLLRNLLVKAVIRVGAGYFERDSGFFLIGSGGSGADLRRFTEERIALAMQGLKEEAGLEIFENR
jgi:fructosamine-3-kinase